MLSLNQITLSRGNKRLLHQSSLIVHEKQKLGLVGHNGCGKSSLFRLILGELSPDQGQCLLNSQLRVSHLAQELPDCDESALDFVLAGDEAYIHLKQRLSQAENQNNADEILLCHELLAQTAGYSKPAQAASIMAGLGFKTEQEDQAVNAFSGGWRMRLCLARCLMKPADLILLDEPTNHLDIEAIFWLEKWLKQSLASILVISHDREFLDAFATHILHIEQETMNLYKGNYSRFEQTRATQLALQQQLYEKQKEKIKHLMNYVNRFRAKASKAKQAQSRLNTIAKMNILAQAQADSPFSFDFYPCKEASNPLLRAEALLVGYEEKQPILRKINWSLNLGDRIALLGPNGEGKSTFMKTITGDLNPISGGFYRSQNLHIGYYAQDQLHELDDQLSPVETIQALSPEAREQNIRDYLGGFNFIGDTAIKPIHSFSGGEKARLALAKLVWQKPNLLLLDEPTNHLDLSMRAAIELALQQYEGALILISHDRHLLRTVVDDFYLVYEKQLKPFRGDLDDYYQWLQSKESLKENNQSAGSNSYREKKNLQNRLKKLEQIVEEHHQQLSALEITLTDLSLYEDGKQSKLQKLIEEQKQFSAVLKDAEEEWLTIANNLELFD